MTSAAPSSSISAFAAPPSRVIDSDEEDGPRPPVRRRFAVDEDELRVERNANDDDEQDEQEFRPVDQVLREEDLREAEIGATHVEFPPGWGLGPSTVPKHPEREAANGASSSSSRPVSFFCFATLSS